MPEMSSDVLLKTLGAEALQRYSALQPEAVSHVTARFFHEHGSIYEKFGQRGREACSEDLAFHLEFLRPVLEFGLLQPMVDYLSWLRSVLTARTIPTDHLAQSLDWLAEFFSASMTPPDSEVVTAALDAAKRGYLHAGVIPTAPQLRQASWVEAHEFALALLAASQTDAMAIVSRCLDSGHSLVDIELHVIQPALYHIGEQWQGNRVTVAQEHIATLIAQFVMTSGLLRSSLPEPNGKRVLLACVSANQHAVGLRMVADAFELAGWEVQNLGANVPTAALVQQVVEAKPHLVGLSVSFPQQLRAVKAIISRLDERLGPARPAVIVGGLAINRFNQLADMVGADACGDNAQTAVNYANQAVGA